MVQPYAAANPKPKKIIPNYMQTLYLKLKIIG